jgi:hypothetical protein
LSDTSKLIIFLVAIALYFTWRNTHAKLASGGASSAGNPIADTSTAAGNSWTSAGNNRARPTSFKETWGDQQ